MLTFAKAVSGGVVAGLAALGGAIASGNVSWAAWVAVASAAVVGFNTVYFVPNAGAATKE